MFWTVDVFYKEYDKNWSGNLLNDKNELTIDVPGFSKEDIKVSIDGTTMTINAERNGKKMSKLFTVSKGLKVVKCTYDLGQIIIKFKEKDSESFDIVIE